jgi:hypothetical protein
MSIEIPRSWRDSCILRRGVGQAIARLGGRKVRAPAGRVPGNAWGARAHGKCSRKDTAPSYLTMRRGKGEMVR